MSGEWIFARDERAQIDLSKIEVPDIPGMRAYAEECAALFGDSDVQLVRDALVAAADVANGAMIALVPQQSDLERLAVEGGEPLDQLHLTLLYLGEADQIEAETRAALIDAGRDMAVGWNGVAGEAFAPALFNPTGPEPCVVMLCSGDELAEFYETALADVSELVDPPDDMHRPWIPHVTLKYFTDEQMTPFVIAAIGSTGPVLFDTLRFAFGGEVTDIPIATTQPPAPEPDPMPVPEATTAESPAGESSSPDAVPEPAVVASGRDIFDGCLRCYGPAHDGQCPPAL